eukprot:TRINITY_DN40_c0_g1_i1.p1 TRINITY_DN40_c0_g1~~TRINITY_DN40_c0_g1_i1.p1  ORF type:complete len:193 (-),score=33.45 TRINITY_DN40_c0_g1_i1:263-757(-)
MKLLFLCASAFNMVGAATHGRLRALSGSVLASEKQHMMILETQDWFAAHDVSFANGTADANATANLSANASAIDAFLPQCLTYIAKLLKRLDRSYTDVQIQPVLEHVCSHEPDFPHAAEDGFSNKATCQEFAEMLANARETERQTGSKDAYEEYCKKYHEHISG